MTLKLFFMMKSSLFHGQITTKTKQQNIGIITDYWLKAILNIVSYRPTISKSVHPCLSVYPCLYGTGADGYTPNLIY